MKCQKCNAENINEAVRCGICGTRLKHQKFIDAFTGSAQVQSSIRRDPKKPLNRPQNTSINRSLNTRHQRAETAKPQRSNDQQQSPSIFNNFFSSNVQAKEKAEIFLNAWQAKARPSSNAKKPSKGLSGKIIWIFIATVMLGPTVFDIVKRNVKPHIAHIFTESVPAEAGEEIAVDQVDAIAAESLEYQVIQRLDELKEVTVASDQYYQKTHQLTTHYQDLVDSDLIVHFINDGQTKFNSAGILESGFRRNPDIKIFLKPYYDTDSDQSAWTCFSSGIDVSEQANCKNIPVGSEP